MKKMLVVLVLVGCSESVTEVTAPGEPSPQVVEKAVMRNDSVRMPPRLIKPPFCPCAPNTDCNCDNYVD